MWLRHEGREGWAQLGGSANPPMPKGTEKLPQLGSGAQPAPRGAPSAPQCSPSPAPLPWALPCAWPCPRVTHVRRAVRAHACPREAGAHGAVPGGALLSGAIPQPALMQLSNQNNFADEYLSRALNI